MFRTRRYEHTIDSLHRALIADDLGFAALILDGSQAVGEPWQDGFSDYDLHVVTKGNSNAARTKITAMQLDRLYSVKFHTEVQFQDGQDLTDLSIKARGKTLHGDPSVIGGKIWPERDIIGALARKQAEELAPAVKFQKSRQVTDVALARQTLYPLLKFPFVCIAATDYAIGVSYPIDRQAVITAHPDFPQLVEIGDTITSISTSGLAELESAMNSLQIVAEHFLNP